MSADLIPEILEADAEGEIAQIYAAIRERWSVPNVTTITRHMATVPGCLEWLWATMAPAMQAGDFQETAWGLARTLDLPPLDPVPEVALRAMGVDAADEARIRDVFHAYNRNNPPNLLFVCCLKRLLKVDPGGTAYEAGRTGWTPPPPSPDLVPMLRPDEMPAETLALARTIGSWGFPEGTGFVPGVYRHLAHWPAYFAHVGAVLWPRLRSGEVARASAAMITAAEAAAADLVAAVPPAGEGFRPPTPERAAALGPVLDGITPKIPEMIVVCRLLEDALPNGKDPT